MGFINIGILEKMDLVTINSIINKPAVNRFFNFSPPLSMEITEKWYEEVIKKRQSKKGECFVARTTDNFIVGWSYIFEQEKLDEPIMKIIKKVCGTEKKGYIAATVVDPDYQGKGIGKMLIKKDEEFLLEHEIYHVWFGTNSDNNSLKKMHENAGYTIIGILPNFKVRNNTFIDQNIYYKNLK